MTCIKQFDLKVLVENMFISLTNQSSNMNMSTICTFLQRIDRKYS